MRAVQNFNTKFIKQKWKKDDQNKWRNMPWVERFSTVMIAVLFKLMYRYIAISISIAADVICMVDKLFLKCIQKCKAFRGKKSMLEKKNKLEDLHNLISVLTKTKLW